MKTFGTIDSKDYTVEDLEVSAPISWELVSGSRGCIVVEPDELEGAISVQRATANDPDFYDNPKVNEDTGTYEYVMYRSIKHLFYNGELSYPNSASLPDDAYVISVGQQFYGTRIKPGTFEISTEVPSVSITDDELGNLYYGTQSLGNVFYEKGIAVIKHNTGSLVTSINANGLKLTSGSRLYVDYESDVRLHRHEIFVKLSPADFNFSLFNPSIFNAYQASGSATASLFNQAMQEQNVKTSGSSDDTYNVYNLMSANVIKPYVTTIGLYSEQYELLAVAKLSEPIQRTFDTDQIFIVRFDV
jgi:hypothetical protein